MTLDNETSNEVTWCFSQVKGTLDDEVTDADIISCVEFNHNGELLATGDKGGRIVIFQKKDASKTAIPAISSSDYEVYSTFQSHEAEFDYLKSLEIEEKINQIRWLKRRNFSHFLLSTNDKTIKLWKISERDKQLDGSNLIGSCRTSSANNCNFQNNYHASAVNGDNNHHDLDDRMETDQVPSPGEHVVGFQHLKVSITFIFFTLEIIPYSSDKVN